MRKRVFLLMAVLLALASAAPARAAPDFWAGFLLNGAFRWGPGTDSRYNADSNANAAGFQYAEVDGTTGAGVVVQTEGAAGFQDGDEDSQEQGLVAGMTQVVASTGDGSALAVQGGAVGQTQTNDCGAQSRGNIGRGGRTAPGRPPFTSDGRPARTLNTPTPSAQRHMCSLATLSAQRRCKMP